MTLRFTSDDRCRCHGDGIENTTTIHWCAVDQGYTHDDHCHEECK